MQDDGGWRRGASRYLFESPWFRLRQDEVTLPGGEDITYTLVDHGGYVVVVPLLDDGRVVMERIYRYTVGRTLLECPSGGLDGEDAETAARRELEEETGYRAGAVETLGSFYGSTGISNERYDVCLATKLTQDGRIQREATEQIEVCLRPLEELRQHAARGRIEDGPSAFALLLAAERLGV
jgi:8-oxo-dGTP pyrophosphatase MutT (NUDIX family)